MNRNDLTTTDWQVKVPYDLRMDANKLSTLEPIIQSEYSNINGIVIARHGSIAYERYFNSFGPDDTHHVASVTKLHSTFRPEGDRFLP